MTTSTNTGAALPTTCDVLIVGAGFGGLYMLHKLRQLGFDAHVIEAAAGVGGTWYWNRYPGARCDIESIQYSYSFDDELQQEWNWSERYAAQPEILAYAEHVADRFGLRSGITFSTRVTATTYDAARNLWMIDTDRGAQVNARFCIAAVGCLSTPQVPSWPGVENFAGEIYHPGAWPHEGVDLRGKRVAVIGTGSSGIQIISAIADEVEHLTVFQRTPTFAFPAHNRPLSPEDLAAAKARYSEIREAARRAPQGRAFATEGRPLLGDTPDQRDEVLRRYWAMGGLDFTKAYDDISSVLEADAVAADFVRDRISEVVQDPAKREVLLPRGHPISAKRPCLEINYFASFNRPNVEIVDVRANPIVEVTATGIRTTAATHDVDVIIVATGYDAMTGTLLRLGVVGRDGVALTEAWAAGPRTYLGVLVDGFPNFFIVAGPGSPSVFSNVILAIEQHVDWISDLLTFARSAEADLVEADPAAAQEWTAHVTDIGERTFLSLGNSWYRGANIPGKPQVVMPYVGGTHVYRDKCDAVAAAGYPGVSISRHRGATVLPQT
ncbi:NAD(P)/FAD-dependent oxidoreductase [Sporichthya brevicatena]|uniref:NAD(P)/FAD-dependent oxidoreductase n=1 Tax=Sporichthya brevicatena TaxID=171442 RepID=A0ABN1GIF8_9ACTN